MTLKCNNCNDEVEQCEECASNFEKGDKVYCGTLGRHWHTDCIGYTATIKENKDG